MRAEYHTPNDGPLVRLDGPFRLPGRFSATLTEVDVPNVDRIDITIGVAGGQPVCEALTLHAAPGRGVTTESLRDVPVASVVRELASNRLLVEVPAPSWAEEPRTVLSRWLDVEGMHPDNDEQAAALAAARQTVGQLGRRKRRPLDEEFLSTVADVYRRGERRGKPTVEVAAEFQVSHSTAAKWVMRARELGVLGPTTPGAAGESTKRRGTR